MSYDEGLEREVFSQLEEWQFSHGISDELPIVYPDSLSDFRALSFKPGDNEGAQESWRILTNHLEAMNKRGWIEFNRLLSGGGSVKLTGPGFERLQWHKDNTFGKRLKRTLLNVFEKATASILTPIVVSVLTVLVMRYLGLDK